MGIALAARAKINLYLAVVGLRPDGYHEIATLFHSIDLADRVHLEPAESLSVRTDPPVGVPEREDLAWRAARQLAEESWTLADDEPAPMGLSMEILKRIPVAAGLGGGSADAAAVLDGANTVWDLGWPHDRLSTVAREVGADVPFMLQGGAAVGWGRGDLLEPLAPWPGLGVALALPERPLSTAEVYGRCCPTGSPIPVEGAAAALSARNLHALAELMRNDLTESAVYLVPEIGDALDIAEDLEVPALMSGSGPAVFALSDDPERLERVRASWAARGFRTIVTALASKGVTPE